MRVVLAADWCWSGQINSLDVAGPTAGPDSRGYEGKVLLPSIEGGIA